METITLQEVIRQHIQLPSTTNARGWFPVLCRVCNDHGKKGPRAGFKFDGTAVGYNCFNCGHSAVFDPAYSKVPSKDMIEVLRAFDIPDTEWKKVSYDAFIHNYSKTIKEYTTTEPNEVPLPRFFYKLTDDPNDEWCQYSIEYLADRGIDWTTYPFYCVRKDSHPDNHRWYGRLIIPILKGDKIVFYLGRDITDLHHKKYLNVNVPRDNVLYGYHNLLVYTDEPLYVVEGWFDAYSLDGVAIFGNKMTQQQIQWLNRSHRPKVVIPDRYGKGHLLAEQAVSLGWNVSFLELNDSCKDVNEAIQRYGLLYTLKTIVDNTCEGNHALVMTNMYCKEKIK